MLTARLNAFWIAAAILPFDPSAFSAETVPVKTLFVIQVPSLRPVAKSQLPQPESKPETKTVSASGQADITGADHGDSGAHPTLRMIAFYVGNATFV